MGTVGAMKANQSATFLLLSVLPAAVACGTATASEGFPDPTDADGGSRSDAASGTPATGSSGTQSNGAPDASDDVTEAGTGGGSGDDTSAASTGGGASGASTGGTGTNSTGTGGTGTSPGSNQALHVEGNKFVYQGKPTRLLGVNHSGTEYTCLSSGIFEGPDADDVATGILSWGNINAVRIPLNEDCWLGINGINAQYAGTNYQSAILAYVAKLHAHGLFTIVDLHWNAPGSFQAKNQQPMADADHSVDFWKSVAGAFKSDAMTVFDLYNEPYIDTTVAQTSDPWDCWLNGCTITQGRSGVTGNWQSAGMQTLLDAVRSTGATNVVMAGGLNFADDLTSWLTHVPNDPQKQVVAALHAYSGGPCAVSSCWTGVLEPIAAQYPIVTGELGEYDCGHSFIDSFFAWADTAGVSYVPWTWNTWDCGSGPALISDYSGTATGFGEGYEMHMMTTKP